MRGLLRKCTLKSNSCLHPDQEGFEDPEWRKKYHENQSSRNSIKITGVPEEEEEKTWDDTEAIMKNLISDTLGIEVEAEIERAHCIGKKQGNLPQHQPDGSAPKEPRRPKSVIGKI